MRKNLALPYELAVVVSTRCIEDDKVFTDELYSSICLVHRFSWLVLS